MKKRKSTEPSQNEILSQMERKQDGETRSIKNKKMKGEPDTGEGEARVRWAT